MPERTCSVEGCARKHQARGMCSTCYNRTRYTADQRHAKVAVPCSWCAQPCAKDASRGNRYANLFCSMACRDAWRARQSDMRKLPTLFTGIVDRPAPSRPMPRQRAPRLFIAGSCARCGSSFLAEDYTGKARYCSAVCLKRASRQAWKERTDRLVPAAVRAYVYERDRWICWLCRKPIRRDVHAPHPLSHSVDHVVPQSEGGTHEPGNLRAAHFRCNSLRGAGGGGEQLALL